MTSFYTIQNAKKNFKQLIFTDSFTVACGGSLRNVEGNITGPTSLPFNQSSYVCHWRLEPPENMIVPGADSLFTLTIKLTGHFSGPERASIIRKNCIYPQYIEIHGKIKNTMSFVILAH